MTNEVYLFQEAVNKRAALLNNAKRLFNQLPTEGTPDYLEGYDSRKKQLEDAIDFHNTALDAVNSLLGIVDRNEAPRLRKQVEHLQAENRQIRAQARSYGLDLSIIPFSY